MHKTQTTVLSSLDRTTSHLCSVAQPDSYESLFDLVNNSKSIIPMGSGASYIAASFGEDITSVSTKNFCRVLNFDQKKKELSAEGGISLGQLYDFLTPKGLYISVQPGHPQISLAGLIAANAHGKNQYKEGVFRDIVKSFEIYHPNHGQITASRSKNKELFDLTFGAYGLTGIILSVTLTVTDIPSTHIVKKNIKVENLEATLEQIFTLKDQYDFLQSWHDLTHKKLPGRGFITCGKFQDKQDIETACAAPKYKQLLPHSNYFRPPVFNTASMACVNRVFYKTEMRKKEKIIDLFSYLFPVANKRFYFDFYGPNGLIEHQVLIPMEQVQSYISKWSELIKTHNILVPRASMKLFNGKQKYLWYNGSGISLSFDLFNSQASLKFLEDVDQLDIQHQAICNIIKDSRLKPGIVSKYYPDFFIFKDKINAWDRRKIFKSALSERMQF